jgi:hypothetical protein
MKEKKREPWRIVVGVLAIAFIVYMWAKKEIAAAYSTLPPEQLLPVLVTTIGVTLLKIGAMAGGILLLRWIIGKTRQH